MENNLVAGFFDELEKISGRRSPSSGAFTRVRGRPRVGARREFFKKFPGSKQPPLRLLGKTRAHGTVGG